MNFSEIQLWPLLAGLGLFLFGMYMLEEALKALAGRSFKKFLRKHTTNPVKAVLSGTLVTAVLQSSSMVSLLVMSFAGAGIIGLSNGIGMILGANLGTTMTGWLVSLIGFKLNIGKVILPFLALGGLGITFLKKETPANFSKFLMGFSLLFLGLNYMKEGFEAFAMHFDFSFLNDKHPFLFILIGLLLAASLHSSSASMMIFLSSLSAEVISLQQAIYLVIGADMGTTITALIATINGNSIRQKVGYSQFFFNLFTMILTLLMMNVYRYIIIDMMGISDPLIALVTFHSTMNAVGILCLLPLIGYFTKFINKMVVHKEDKLARNIMLVNPEESHAAIEALRKEAVEFTREALRLNYTYFNLTPSNNIAKPAYGKEKAYTYIDLKNYESEIAEFYIRILKNTLIESEVTEINAMIEGIRNATLSAKDIKDILHNLDELSASVQDELFEFYQSVRENQKKFYDEVFMEISRIGIYTDDDTVRLREILKSYYHHETETIYQIFSAKKHRDVAIPNLLNMVREINNSNEALLRAIQNVFMAEEVKITST